MAFIARWVFRTAAMWALGKAWQTYQERKEREKRHLPRPTRR